MDCRVDRISVGGSCIDTVRALHQTITSLRAALEESRSEITELKSRKLPIGTAETAVKNLSIENHLLRQELLNTNKDPKFTKDINKNDVSLLRNASNNTDKTETDTNVRISTEKLNGFNKKHTRSILPDKKSLGPSKTLTFSNTFEGDNQIQTCSSLRIKNTKQSQEKNSKT